MTVTLLTYTPQPEKTVACAAKLCYSASGVDQLYEGLTNEKASDFVQMLAEIGHESPIEHASFTFALEGVSRSLLAQITRHRLASFSVQSQRYVKESDFSFVTPPEIAADPAAHEVFLKSMERAVEDYNTLADLLQKRHEQSFLDAGLPEKEAKRKAEKKAIEDANDKMMISSYCLHKLEVVNWYLQLLEEGSEKYIVPQSKEKLESIRDQLMACHKEIMSTKISKSSKRPLLDIKYPPGYEG